MSEYGCGHEIFDYNEDGTYVKVCSLCGYSDVEPEPTYTASQVQEIIEGIAVRIEAIDSWQPAFQENQKPVLNYTPSMVRDESGNWLNRSQVLATIRTTPLGVCDCEGTEAVTFCKDCGIGGSDE